MKSSDKENRDNSKCLGKCSEMVRKVILCMFIIPYITAKFTIVIRNGKIF